MLAVRAGAVLKPLDLEVIWAEMEQWAKVMMVEIVQQTIHLRVVVERGQQEEQIAVLQPVMAEPVLPMLMLVTY